MATSELTDALNPYALRRASIAGIGSAAVSGRVAPAAQPYMPHRSELEVAILEPPLRSQQAQQSFDLARRTSQAEGTVSALQELFRVVKATRDAQEMERKRRIAWERELEAQAALRQAEAEHKIREMREEIDQLRAALQVSQQDTSFQETGLLTPHYHSSSSVESIPRRFHPITPLSPISRQTTFTQEHGDNFSVLSQATEFRFSGLCSGRPSPDPRLIPGVSSESSPNASSVSPDTSPSPTAIRLKHKRRGRSLTPSSGRDSDNSCDSSRSRTCRPPRKRLNHHDKRCLTIQHAMRAHFWRMLKVDHDERLPDSHGEGIPLEQYEPIRFVWDKTTKQSVHNARMKLRILADIKENRQMYKHVPSKDFGKKILDAAFEQCFTTFRQKYRAQNDVAVAIQTKKREEAKARKARHVSRRKMKLSNRAESRMKLPEFENVIFDPALQIECMSSEESDFEDGIRSTDTLRTRGYAWRSSRLLRFYYTLDQEEMSDKSTKPKRGVGKRDRITGPPKESDLLPPKGVATWMISRRWLKVTQVVHPDLPEALDNLVDSTVQYDWGRFHVLGEETELSDEDTHEGPHYEFPPLHMPSTAVQPQHRSTASSLEYALAVN